MVELTEREHLILSRAENLHQSITKRSKHSRRKYAVEIFLMKLRQEVHIRGRNYHQGLQELFKEIKLATKRWEHNRSTFRSSGEDLKSTANVVGILLTGESKDVPFSSESSIANDH